jgi:hypothetical protein
MSEHSVERLFDEFATAYRRGERPDVGAFLARAGEERDDLASMVDEFLRAVPAREPAEEEIVLMQARLEREPALLVLRRRRKLTREAVVGALVSALGLDPAKQEKVAGYYHQLEVGTLDPKPVSSRVWNALGDLLHANVRLLAGLRPEPVAESVVFLREARYLASWDADVDHSRSEQPASTRSRIVPGPPPGAPSHEQQDEIDRLFTADR